MTSKCFVIVCIVTPCLLGQSILNLVRRLACRRLPCCETAHQWANIMSSPNVLTLYAHSFIMSLSHALAGALEIPDSLLLFILHPIVLEHPGVLPYVLALDFKSGLRFFRFQNKVVVAVGTVFVAVVKILQVLAEAFLALLAGKDHLQRGLQRM